MKKRLLILSIAFAVILLLSLTASAEGTTPGTVSEGASASVSSESPKTISVVAFERPAAPVPGARPAPVNLWPQAGVWVTGIWTRDGMPVLFPFKAGETYVLAMSVYPESGWQFAENISVLIDGSPVGFSKGSASLGLSISYTLTEGKPEPDGPAEITEWNWKEASQGQLEIRTEDQGPSFSEVCGMLPSSIETNVGEAALTGWSCPAYAEGPDGWPGSGTFLFTASLPGGYVLAEGVPVPTVTLVLTEDEKEEEIFTQIPGKTPGCTESGYLSHFIDETGNLYIEEPGKMVPVSREDLLLPALGHAWSETSYHWNEDLTSCTASRVCTRDPGHMETAEAVVTVKETRAPSCEAPGEKTITAVFSESWAVSQTKIAAGAPALNHAWSEISYHWNEDLTSCTASRKCTRDPGHVETAEAVVTVKETRAPSCEVPGEKTITAVFSESWAVSQTKIAAGAPALGHIWGETVYQWSEDGKSCTAIRHCLRNHAHQESEAGKVTSQVTREPTEDFAGQTTYVAQFSESYAAAQKKVLNDLKKLPHTEKKEDPIPPKVDSLGRVQGKILTSEDGEPGLLAYITLDYLVQFCRDAHQRGDTEGITFTCGPVSAAYDLKALDAVILQAQGAELLAVSVQKTGDSDRRLNDLQTECLQKNGKAKLYSVSLTAAGAGKIWEIHDFKDGKSQISVPYHRAEGYRISTFRVEKDGTLSSVPCRYDVESGTVTFETPSHSHYIVLPNSLDFILAWACATLLIGLLAAVMFRNRKGILDFMFLY